MKKFITVIMAVSMIMSSLCYGEEIAVEGTTINYTEEFEKGNIVKVKGLEDIYIYTRPERDENGQNCKVLIDGKGNILSNEYEDIDNELSDDSTLTVKYYDSDKNTYIVKEYVVHQEEGVAYILKSTFGDNNFYYDLKGIRYDTKAEVIAAGKNEYVLAADEANPCVSVTDTDGQLEIEYGNATKTVPYKTPLLMINGDMVFDEMAVIKNGTTLVPMRIVSEKLGADVSWNDDIKTVVIVKGSTIINAAIGESYITVNGSSVTTDVPSEIINSRIYVPLRAIAQSFGADVGFYNEFYIPLVYVSTKGDKANISEAEAVDRARAHYFGRFLPAMYEHIKELYGVEENINQLNISEYFPFFKYKGEVKADFGKYYYVQLFENSVDGVLVDKFDGSCYPVSSFSLGVLRITKDEDFGAWALDYQ